MVSNSVYGSDLVELLSQEGHPNTKSLSQDLLNAKFLVSHSGSSELAPSNLYELVHIKGADALNTKEVATCGKKSAERVAEDIRFLKITSKSIMFKQFHFRDIVSRLFGSFLIVDGKRVDYQGIATSTLWLEYKKMATQLQRVDVEGPERDDRLAFFINIYNILCIHGLIDQGVPSNLLARFQ